MQITRDFTIAVHALLCVEFFKKNGKVNSEFVAKSCGVNPVIIRGIFGKLKSAGIVEIKRGGSGGVFLLIPPQKITLLDVYKAVEADKRPLINFHENPNPKCPVGKNIHAALDDCLLDATSALEKSFKKKNLALLLNAISEKN